MATEQVQLEIVAQFDKALAEFRKISSESQKAFTQIEKNTSFASKAFSSFVGNLSANIAVKALETLAGGFGRLTQFVSESIQASAEQEAAINALNVSLAAAGNFSVQASNDLQKFASQLQETSRFGDEVVLKNAALLESLAQLDTDGLKVATQASADLAAALGIDLETAVTLVGKAAQGQIGSFARYGIAIQKGKTDAETFDNTLRALQERFGGRALAEISTFAGANTQLSNIFSDLQEVVGDTVTQNGFFVEIIKIAGEVIKQFTGFIQNNSDTIKAGLAAAFATIIDLTRGLLTALDPIARTIVTTFETVGKAIAGVAVAIVEIAQGNFRNAGEAIKATFNDIGKTLDENLTRTGALQGFADGLGNIKTRAEDAFASFQTGAERAANITNANIRATRELTAAQIELQKSAQKILETQQQAGTGDESKAERELAIVQQAFEQRLIAEQEFLASIEQLRMNADIGEAERLIQRNEALAQIDSEKNAAEIEANNIKINNLLEQEGQASLKLLQIQAQRAQKEKQLQDQKRQKELQDQQAFFAAATSLASSENKNLAAIGKAAAVAEIAIKTPQAVGSSFAFGTRIGGPPLGFVFAGIAAAAMAAQAAKVAGLQTGIDSVPGTGTRDNFPALLSPGERVVPRRTNQDLTAFLSGANQTNELLAGILGRLDRLESNVVVNIGSKEIIDVVNTGIREGRVLAS